MEVPRHIVSIEKADGVNKSVVEDAQRKPAMKTIHHRRTFLNVALVGVLALSLFTGCTNKNDDFPGPDQAGHGSRIPS